MDWPGGGLVAAGLVVATAELGFGATADARRAVGRTDGSARGTNAHGGGMDPRGRRGKMFCVRVRISRAGVARSWQMAARLAAIRIGGGVSCAGRRLGGGGGGVR